LKDKTEKLKRDYSF